MRAMAGLGFALILGACAPAVQPTSAFDYAAGEIVEAYPRPGAALRDAQGRDSQRVTVWYPAAADTPETPRVIGPMEQPFFVSGQAADGAGFAAREPLPLIVISHGFGGSARQMAWLGTALARAGYVVAAVDHPGNNGTDDRTPLGALLYWERADDLHHALDALLGDPEWGPRIDHDRIGAIGYSMGGASVLIELGARPDPRALIAWCARSLRNQLCGDTISDGDFGTVDRRQTLRSSAAVRSSVASEASDRNDERIDAAVLIAPALGPLLANDQLRRVDEPVLILQGERDQTTPADENASAFIERLPHGQLRRLDGTDHNAFLGLCTEAGRSRYAPLCEADATRPDTHSAAIAAITTFFDETLAAP